MKRILLILVLAAVSCYDDDSTFIESNDTAHNTSKLTTNIKSISLHDASYDDIIDNSSCFSLEFPYQVSVNSEIRTINSVEDINAIDENDELEIIYPVSAVFYNYEKHQITSSAEFDLIANTCEEDFDITAHSCLDIQYPVAVKMFNQVGNDFHTMNVGHDQALFTLMDNLHDTDVYEIDYPILLNDHSTGTVESINSNLEFETIFDSTSVDCQ